MYKPICKSLWLLKISSLKFCILNINKKKNLFLYQILDVLVSQISSSPSMDISSPKIDPENKDQIKSHYGSI
jgi:hypothetical protein